MTNDELTAAVTDLEHYLFDIWKYDELHEIGRLFFHLNLDREPGDAQQRQLARDGSAELQRLLANSYQCALIEIDEVVPGLGEGPVVAALLEKLSETVALLAHPQGAYLQWLERTWQPPSEDDRFASEDADSGGLILRSPPNDPREHFSYVSKDFAFYVNKVVTHIDQYRTRKEGDPDTVTGQVERIRWNDTAALLGYLFNELARNEYITPPQRKENGELKPNWAAVARTLHATFDIRKEKGEPVTLASLTQVLKMGGADYKSGPNHFKIKQRQG